MKELLEKLNEANVKLGIRIAAVVAMACFFFPFFTVSCSGQTIELTGNDIAKGRGDYVEPHPIVYGVLILAGIALVATFVARMKPWRKLVGLACSAAGLVLMVMIRNGFVNAMKEAGASSEEIAKYSSIEFGFWGCVLGYLAIGVFSWLYGRYMAETTAPTVTGAVSQPAVSQPATSQPTVSQPVTSQPVVSQSPVSRPVVPTPAQNSHAQLAGKKKPAPAANTRKLPPSRRARNAGTVL